MAKQAEPNVVVIPSTALGRTDEDFEGDVTQPGDNAIDDGDVSDQTSSLNESSVQDDQQDPPAPRETGDETAQPEASNGAAKPGNTVNHHVNGEDQRDAASENVKDHAIDAGNDTANGTVNGTANGVANATADDKANDGTGDQLDTDDLGLRELDWEQLQSKFYEEMGKQTQVEEKLKAEFRDLTSLYLDWASVPAVREEQRAAKRLRTRIAFVQNEEHLLENRKIHLKKVQDAFQSALRMLDQEASG